MHYQSRFPHRAGHAASTAHRKVVQLFHFAAFGKGGLLVGIGRITEDDVDQAVLHQGHEHKTGRTIVCVD